MHSLSGAGLTFPLDVHYVLNYIYNIPVCIYGRAALKEESKNTEMSCISNQRSIL